MAPNATIDAMMKNASPEDQKKGMDDWTAWMDAHKADLADMGAPTGKNKRVTKGGVSDTRNEVCGYTIVEADSHDAAAALFADCPHLEMDGAYVEVLECLEMDGK
jgi:hypothetical protein